ncbi:MAG: hypothetical protein ACLRQF_06560 [Thomasclavelia ramosa]
MIACVSMMLRFRVYALFPINMLFGNSIVHCIGVAIATVASLTYIRNSVDPAVLGTAITLLNATLSIGKAIYGYIFGVVYEIWGSFIMFGICLIPFVIAFLMISRSHCFDEIDKHKGHIA